MGMKTLRDGRQVDSASEEWRFECEARAVLAMPTKDQRQKHLEYVTNKRSAAEGQALKDEIMEIWNNRQN